MVFYYSGDFRGLTDILSSHEKLDEIQDDKQKSGLFYAWLGFALTCRMRLSKSYQYLEKALKIGKEVECQKVIGYASTWLSWACINMGDLDKAIYYGERAQEISKFMPEDQYLYFKSLAGIGLIYFMKGEKKKSYETGKKILEYSRKHSNTRCMVLSYYIIGFSLPFKPDGSDFWLPVISVERLL